MSVHKITKMLLELNTAGFTGDQAARIIAADMIAAQLADLNKNLKDLNQTVRLKKF